VKVITEMFFGIFLGSELAIMYITSLFKLRPMSFQDALIQEMLLT